MAVYIGERKFVRVDSDLEILESNFELIGKRVVDVGCGYGGLTALLAPKVMEIYGIDHAPIVSEIVEKRSDIRRNEVYQIGSAENLQLPDNYSDIMLFIASFHHIPDDAMTAALNEIVRVSRNGGHVLILEPVSEQGTYSDLIAKIEDERDILKKTEAMIDSLNPVIYQRESESFYYIQRSSSDYRLVIESYISDKVKRNQIWSGIQMEYAEESLDPDSIQFKSLCRVVILRINK